MMAARLVLALAFALSGLAGCLGLERPYPEKRYYAVDAKRPGKPRAAPPFGPVRIASTRISPAFATARLVSRMSETRYESSFYDEFFFPPAAMVGERIQAWLDASGLFASVVTAESLLEAGLVIETAIPALYADLRDAAAPKAVLELQAVLVRDAGSGPKILARLEERREEPMKDRSAAAFVDALDRALGAALMAMEAEIAKIDPKSTGM